MKKLAVILTHPIQYYAPIFQLLSKDSTFSLKVFYTWGEQSLKKYDPGFQQIIEWDIPVLDGYSYEFLENISPDPGTHHFRGIINPDAIDRIELFSPDAILIFGWNNQSHLRLIRYFNGKIPVWFRGDSTLLDPLSIMRRAVRTIFLRWVYSYVDRAFYVGKNNRNYFLRHGLRAHQLIFAPHAIDNDRFSEDRLDEAERLRSDLGIAESNLLILFAGKLEEKKDPETLLAAFRQLNDANCHLLFVGNGILEERLKGVASSIKNVHFLGFQNQLYMPVVYKACDLFCLPSKGPGETWGLAVNEAMASGKAILISNKVGCGTDLVECGVNGEIFEYGNLKSCLEKLMILLRSNQLDIYGKNSQQIIGNWTINKVVESIRSEINALN